MKIVPKASPNLPEVGKLMLTRYPHSNILKVTWPDGQNRVVFYDKNGDVKLMQLGLPGGERLRKLLNYVWNFNQAYVTVDPENVTPPAPLGLPRPFILPRIG